MLTITVDFLLGTFRGDPAGLAATGEQTLAEWPPAPLRLLAALVAADGTRDLSRFTDGSELSFLETCAPPVIHASPTGEVHHQPLRGRFVVVQKEHAEKGKSHQEYPARAGALVRPGVRASPRCTRVVYEWDVTAPPSIIDGLARRAARVGYLGAADSPVQVTVGTDDVAGSSGVYRPDAGGTVVLGVPRPGVVAAMDAHYDRWLVDGPSVTRAQSAGLRRLARYRAPGEKRPLAQDPSETIWFRLSPPISGRRVSAVTAAFKAALLDRYQRVAGDPPAVLHGHGFGGDAYELARFLALPDAGHPHATGLIHGLALWLPPNEGSDVVAACHQALVGMSELHGAGFVREVAPWGGEARPRACAPDRWKRASARWATVFPAVHARHGTEPTFAEIARWCRHAGFSERLVSARSTRHPLIDGGVDLVPAEVNRPGRPARPYSHLELDFAAAVAGPVVIGSGRHRGLGLCTQIERLPS